MYYVRSFIHSTGAQPERCYLALEALRAGKQRCAEQPDLSASPKSSQQRTHDVGGTKSQINIRLSHSGSSQGPIQGGYRKSWFDGSLCLRGLSGPFLFRNSIQATIVHQMIGVLILAALVKFRYSHTGLGDR